MRTILNFVRALRHALAHIKLRSMTQPGHFQTLYRGHHHWLQSWLRKKLGCPEQAADIAQDTFVRVLAAENERPLQQILEPRAYLTTIAKRLMVDFFRRADLERAYLAELAALPEALQPSPEQRLQALQLLQEMDQMLDGLSPRVRQAWLYSRLDGLKHADIAELMDVSVPRVRQYLARAARQAYILRFGTAEPGEVSQALPAVPSESL
nr:sigma-70 family RNA polymerase sigma factor [Methylobacillus glycogenes]